MFTEQQLKEAHAKTKTGVDYPNYVQDLKKLGVIMYDFMVENGQNIFYGRDNFSINMPPKYEKLTIAKESSKEKLAYTIAIHQQGQTNFATFCQQAAEAGIEKWSSDLERMLVIYIDKQGNELIAEPIPVSY